MKYNRSIIFSLTLCLLANPANGSNFLREQRIAKSIEKHLVIGQAKWLEANGEPFLSIFTETERESLQGVIILHGMNAHPNSAEVIYPLRTQLTEFGWSTLSIQTPVLAASASYADYLDILDEIPPRIEAAIQFYKSIGVKEIFIIGHSFGAMMSVYYFSTFKEKTKLRGLIAISLSGEPQNTVNPLKLIEKVKSPLLDISAGFDIPSVKNTRKARKLAATRGQNTAYRQSEITEAGHFYRGAETALVKKIRGWMHTILNP